MPPLRFFDPFAEIEQHKNLLPHWQQPGATYFLTFRLGDSIPESLRAQWQAEREAWMKHHPEPWTPEVEREYHEQFSAQIDRWLDAGHGKCWLRRTEIRRYLVQTLQRRDGDRYVLHAWVAMPNHVHVLVSLHPEARLEDEVGAWKSISSRAINRGLGRHGALWQEDYFDRLVRDARHFANCVRYIWRNPEKARLRTGQYELWESELARSIGTERGG